MPGKHVKQVRFAYQNTYHSPPSPTPPPLYFSSSTATSSSGPVTPPTAMQIISRPSYVAPIISSSQSKTYPSFSRSSGRIQPHPYLDMSAITWDLMDHPSTIARNHHSLSSRILREPATNPPIGFISIISPYFPWTIKVLPSYGAFITVEDVLHSIYRTLRANITPSEFNLFSSPNEQKRATRAYEQRYRRQRCSRIYEEEKRGGMKRVDFLMGHTRFLGISNVGRRPDEWQLMVT